MKTALLPGDIEKYGQRLSLPDRTKKLLREETLLLERVQTLVEQVGPLALSHQLADELDCYHEKDDSVVVESYEAFAYLLSPEGLAADGFVLRTNDGESIGYSLFYPVTREERADLPPEYVAVRERAQWPALAAHLSELLQRDIPLEKLWHHYDYAVKIGEFRNCGLGKFLLAYTLDNIIPPHSVTLGFISSDTRYLGSSLASTKAGLWIGKEVTPSPDGDHLSFLLIGTRDIPRYTGRTIENGQPNLDRLPDLLREIVSEGRSVVGYNKERQCLEEAVFEATL